MTVPTQPTLNPLLTSQSQSQAQPQPQSQRPGPRLTLSSSAPGSSPPSSPSFSSSPAQSVSNSISSFCASLSTTLTSSTTRLSKFTRSSIAGITSSSPTTPTSPTRPTPRSGVRFSIQVPPPSTPLTPFGVSPRYTDAPASPPSGSTLISPPYSSGPYPYPYGGPASPPYSPTSALHNGHSFNPYSQSVYADMWARRLHVLSRYVAYYGRTYYILALLSVSALTLLYITAAILLHLEANGQPGTGPGGLHVEVVYCILLAFLAVPITGCVWFLTQCSNKPNLLHWKTQTDFHMMSGVCLAACSFVLYTLTTLPSSPLSSICTSLITYAGPQLAELAQTFSISPDTSFTPTREVTIDWICLISGVTQGLGVLTGGLFLLSSLTTYFNAIRFVNSLPLDIIQDPESPGYWRGVNVGDVDWVEERFFVL